MNEWVGRPYLALLGGKEEDRFTQYLCELLRSQLFLDAFLHEICGIEIPHNEPLTTRTQVTVPGGRPDLAVRGNSLYPFFEAKVASWLHERQLTPYARELEDWQCAHPAGTASLFVLTPQRHATGIVASGYEVLQAANLSKWHPRAVTWEQVAGLCKELAPRSNDPRLALHLQEFAEVVFHRLGEPFRPFTGEEAILLEDPLVARAICRARLLVDRVCQILSGRGFTFSSSKGFLWDGFTAKFQGRTWWYGVWIDVWAKVGSSPIFIQLGGFSGRSVPPIPEGLPAPVAVQFGNLEQVVPLPLRDGVDIEELALEQADIMWRYANELPESGAG